MYVEIRQSSNGQYYFVIRSNGNHYKLATSELYINKADAVHAAHLIADYGTAQVVDKVA